MKIFANKSLRFLGNLDVQTTTVWTRPSTQLQNCEGTLLFFKENIQSEEQLRELFGGQNQLTWEPWTRNLVGRSCLQIPVRVQYNDGGLNLTQLTSRNTVIGEWYYPPTGIQALVRTNNTSSAQGNLNGLHIRRHKMSICNNQILALTADTNPTDTTFVQGKHMVIRSSAYTARGSLLDNTPGRCGVLATRSGGPGNGSHPEFHNSIRFTTFSKFNFLYIRREEQTVMTGIMYWNREAAAWREVNTNSATFNLSTHRFTATDTDLGVLFRFPERETTAFWIRSAMLAQYADNTVYARSIVAGHTDNIYENIPDDTIKFCIYLPNNDLTAASNGLPAGNLSNLNLEDYPMLILPVGNADSDAPIRLNSLDIGHTDQPQTKQLVYGRIKYELR